MIVPLIKIFKDGKVKKSLSEKDRCQYNCLDKIFEYYLSGRLQKLLNSFHFQRINIYPEINRKGRYLQIECSYSGLTVDIGCDEDCYDYSFYLPGISAEEFAKSIVQKKYDDNFDVETFFLNFYKLLQTDFRVDMHVNIKCMK